MSIIWKVLDGYSRYEISNSGLVKNIKTGAVLKTVTNVRVIGSRYNNFKKIEKLYYLQYNFKWN